MHQLMILVRLPQNRSGTIGVFGNGEGGGGWLISIQSTYLSLSEGNCWKIGFGFASVCEAIGTIP